MQPPFDLNLMRTADHYDSQELNAKIRLGDGVAAAKVSALPGLRPLPIWNSLKALVGLGPVGSAS